MGLFRGDAVSILLIVLLITFSLILLFFLSLALTYTAEIIFKFLTGSCLCLGNIKLTLGYKSLLGKALLWKLKILDKKKEEAEIVKQICQAGIRVINGGSDHGMRDIIILKELEKGVKTLPAAIIDSVNNHPAGPFILVVSDDVGENQWGEPTIAMYKHIANQCQVAKARGLLLEGYRNAIIHEIGHAFEIVLSPERPVEFEYFKEWFLFIDKIPEPPPTEYAKENRLDEDFAETFKLYFAKPDYLKRARPLRYKQMEKILQQANIKR